MNQFDFFIDYPVTGSNWQQIPPADNWQAMELELSFEDLAPDAVFNATKLVWKGSNAALMNTWLTGGLAGTTPGIFEGIGMQIRVCASQEVVFNGIIDLTDPETKFACDIVTVRIRDKNIDMFQQLVDSISFAFLTTIPVTQPGYIRPGNITTGSGDYVPIAYQRNDIPSLESIMTLILTIWSIYSIIHQLADAVTRAIDSVGESISSYPAALEIIWYALLTVWYIILSIALSIMVISLLEVAVNCLVSPVLQKYGMFARTLMQRGCDYFGIGFSSTILNDPASPYYNLVSMPMKNAYAVNENMAMAVLSLGSVNKLMEYDDVYNLSHNGGTAYGYYDGSVGDFIRSMEDVFNAKAKIILDVNGNPVLHFERWDYQYVLPQYTLPPISDQVPFNSHGPFNATGQSQSAFATNASEIIANYSVKWAIDSSDLNTLNDYLGNSCFATTQPNAVTGGFGGPYQNRVLLMNLKEVDFEFALATRKEYETALEKFFEVVWQFIMGIITVIEVSVGAATFGVGYFTLKGFFGNLPSNLAFTNSGHMYLSSDITGAPKLMIVNSQPVAYTALALDITSHSSARNFIAYTLVANNKGQVNGATPSLSARALMREFHYSTLAMSRVPADPQFAKPYNAGSVHYNQWFVYTGQQIPLCCADYQLVKNNNYITIGSSSVIGGATQAKVDKLQWNPFKGIATIDYRINAPYTSNLSVNFVVDGVSPTYDINTI